MGIFDALRGELVDIIEWIDDSRHTLVWRFPRYRNQIKNGAQLIVRPGQAAVLVKEGRLADIFEPGRYELSTNSLPLLSTLLSWKHGFDSPFKCEVYFVSTRQITDLKWGTPNPIVLRDADFGPVRLRAFGTYTLKAVDPAAILRELVGTDGVFEADEISELMRANINTAFADMLGTEKIAVLDLAQNYQELSEKLRRAVVERVDDEYGLDVPQLFIMNVSLPEAVEKAIDTRSSMSVIGDMRAYQQYQMGTAMQAAAENPAGGGAGAGMGLGAGFAMAGQMMQGMAPPAGGLTAGPGAGGGPGAPPVGPPPIPAAPPWFYVKDGQTVGPVPADQLMAAVQGGDISGQTLVWTAGMAAWSAASTVPTLAAQFQTPPPPPPPTT